MIHDQPRSAVLYEGEAVASGQGLCFAVLDERKRVIAGVDRGVAVYANQLLPKSYLEAGKRGKRSNKIIAQGGRIGAYRGRQRPPQNGILGIEREDRVGIVLSQSDGPFCGRGRNVFLGPRGRNRCNEQRTQQ